MVSKLAEGKMLLVAGDYGEVSKGLKGLLADANVSVVACAARAIGALAGPLGRDYAGHAKKVTSKPRGLPALFPRPLLPTFASRPPLPASPSTSRRPLSLPQTHSTSVPPLPAPRLPLLSSIKGRIRTSESSMQ